MRSKVMWGTILLVQRDDVCGVPAVSAARRGGERARTAGARLSQEPAPGTSAHSLKAVQPKKPRRERCEAGGRPEDDGGEGDGKTGGRHNLC